MIGFRRRRKKPRRHLVKSYYSPKRHCYIRAHFRGRKKRRY